MSEPVCPAAPTLPLAGRRIVVTRSAGQADTLAAELEALGAQPILFPTIDLAALPVEPLLAALGGPEPLAWLLFTSATGVRFFAAALAGQSFSLPPAAAVGAATAAALEDAGLSAAFVPSSATGRDLAKELAVAAGERVLLPRARRGRPEIAAELERRGVIVVDIPLYDTVRAAPPPEAYAALASGVDAITFTSPSTAQNFAALTSSTLPAGARVACIGPTTAGAVAALGWPVTVVAEEQSAAGLAAALAAYYEGDTA